tara:strand:- start:1152 stop:1424 length:273 start_codon:yes stop_codon:yes gene_type:complete
MSKIIKAIMDIDPTARVTIIEPIANDVDTCVINWMNETVEISKSDIKARVTYLESNKSTVEAKQETDKANANKKLKDLGLTEDEIEAIKS